jgi:hypothetical protein
MTTIAYFTLEEAAHLFNPPPAIISEYDAEVARQRENYERLKKARVDREATANRSTP